MLHGFVLPLLGNNHNRLIPQSQHDLIAQFISSLYRCYVDLYFTYLEVNPLVVTQGKVYILDLAAKLDATAEYLCKSKWGNIDFPPPFGRDALPGEIERWHLGQGWSIMRGQFYPFTISHYLTAVSSLREV